MARNTMILTGKKNKAEKITLRCMTDAEVTEYIAKWSDQYRITVSKDE